MGNKRSGITASMGNKQSGINLTMGNKNSNLFTKSNNIVGSGDITKNEYNEKSFYTPVGLNLKKKTFTSNKYEK